MVNKLHIDPLGATRQLGKRGALKQATFLQLKKNAELLSVESPFEVLLAKLADLSNAVTQIDYQPFTVDVVNERMLLNHAQLQTHRQKLKDSGMSGVFYTPDLRFRWRTPKGNVDEVIEAKDVNWMPLLGDEYTAWRTIQEGKYHPVICMFASLAKLVLTLHRERIGMLVLDDSLK